MWSYPVSALSGVHLPGNLRKTTVWEMTSQVGSQAVAVTSPGKSMAATAWKGAESGRGNF